MDVILQGINNLLSGLKSCFRTAAATDESGAIIRDIVVFLSKGSLYFGLEAQGFSRANHQVILPVTLYGRVAEI